MEPYIPASPVSLSTDSEQEYFDTLPSASGSDHGSENQHHADEDLPVPSRNEDGCQSPSNTDQAGSGAADLHLDKSNSESEHEHIAETGHVPTPMVDKAASREVNEETPQRFIPSEHRPHISEFRQQITTMCIEDFRTWLLGKGLDWHCKLLAEIFEWDMLHRQVPDSSLMRYAIDLSSSRPEFFFLMTFCVEMGQESFFHQLSLYFDDSDLPIDPSQLTAVVDTFDLPNGNGDIGHFIASFATYQSQSPFDKTTPKMKPDLGISRRGALWDFFGECSKVWQVTIPQPALERFNCTTDDLITGYLGTPDRPTYRLLTKEFENEDAAQFKRELDIYRTIRSFPGVAAFKGSHFAISRSDSDNSSKLSQHILFAPDRANALSLERTFQSHSAHNGMIYSNAQEVFWKLFLPVIECMHAMQAFSLSGDQGPRYQGCHGNLTPKNIVQHERSSPFFLTSWGHAAFRKKPANSNDSQVYHGAAQGNKRSPYYNPCLGPRGKRETVSPAQHELWTFGAILFECVLMVTEGTNAVCINRVNRRKAVAGKRSSDPKYELCFNHFMHARVKNPFPPHFHNILGNPSKAVLKKIKSFGKTHKAKMIKPTQTILNIIETRMLVNKIVPDEEIAQIYADLGSAIRRFCKGKDIDTDGALIQYGEKSECSGMRRWNPSIYI